MHDCYTQDIPCTAISTGESQYLKLVTCASASDTGFAARLLLRVWGEPTCTRYNVCPFVHMRMCICLGIFIYFLYVFHYIRSTASLPLCIYVSVYVYPLCLVVSRPLPFSAPYCRYVYMSQCVCAFLFCVFMCVCTPASLYL